MMFDFAQLWADYAVYMPAIQRYYARFIHRPPASPSLAAGIKHQDLDFLSRRTALFKLPAALYSAGVVMEGRSERLLRPLDDMVGRRDPSASYALADSGGFQIISAGLSVTDPLRRRQLRWSEAYFDAALPVDVPSGALHKRGNPYFGRFDLALKDSLRSLDVFDKEHDPSSSGRLPPDPLLRLVPFQGHNPAEAQAWYAAIIEQGYLGRFDGVAFVEDLPISRFHGVGPATAAKMERLGIRTGRDLRERPLAFLQEHFGKAGAHFHAVARGEDDRPVRPDRPRKSAGSETTYPRDLDTPGEVEAGVEALADEVWGWCERTGAFGRTVTVKLRYGDFRTLTRSRSGAEPVGSRAALAAAALELVRGLFPLERKVRLLGVAVSGFGTAGGREDGHQTAFDFGHPRSGREP